ncbi:MAG: hypothetical protein ACREJ3_01065, partial [Polyangiaceae bacterium]
MSHAKKASPGPFDALRALKERLDEEVAKTPKPARDRSAPAQETPAPPVDDAILLAHALSGVEPLKDKRTRVHRKAIDAAGDPDRVADG